MPKVLIIGAAGLLGRYLVHQANNYHYQVFAADITGKIDEGIIPLDICQKEAVEALVEAVSPDWIICPAAMPHVERCEAEPKLSYYINVEGTSNVIDAASKKSAKFVFYSSAYVFDGKTGLYSENDVPNPLSVYGKHKLIGEERTLNANSNNLVIRTDGVFGFEKQPKNFVLSVLNRLKNNEPVRAPIDQSGNPTYAKWLAEKTLQLLEHQTSGIYNVCGHEPMRRIDFARLIAKVFGYNPQVITECLTEELHQLAPRPQFGTLITEKLNSTLAFNQESLSSQLMEVESELEK